MVAVYTRLPAGSWSAKRVEATEMLDKIPTTLKQEDAYAQLLRLIDDQRVAGVPNLSELEAAVDAVLQTLRQTRAEQAAAMHADEPIGIELNRIAHWFARLLGDSGRRRDDVEHHPGHLARLFFRHGVRRRGRAGAPDPIPATGLKQVPPAKVPVTTFVVINTERLWLSRRIDVRDTTYLDEKLDVVERDQAMVSMAPDGLVRFFKPIPSYPIYLYVEGRIHRSPLVVWRRLPQTETAQPEGVDAAR